MGCYQGILGSKAAEERLRGTGEAFTYLTRESDIRKGKFLLSWLSSDGSIKHTTAPYLSARKSFKNLDEALPVMERMILSNDECVNPVPRHDCNTSAQLQRSSRKVPPITRWLSGGRHLLLTGRTLLKCHFM